MCGHGGVARAHRTWTPVRSAGTRRRLARLDLGVGAAGGLMIADSCTAARGVQLSAILAAAWRVASATTPASRQRAGSGPRLTVDRNPRIPGGKYPRSCINHIPAGQPPLARCPITTILAAAGRDASAVTANPAEQAATARRIIGSRCALAYPASRPRRSLRPRRPYACPGGGSSTGRAADRRHPGPPSRR
jgi:hypothetical protein